MTGARLLLLLICIFAYLDSYQAIGMLVADDLPIAPARLFGESYHMVTQLVLEETKGSYILEEWASIKEGLFRMDLINQTHMSKELQRPTEIVTFLTFGRSGEVFKYRPHSCSLLLDYRNNLDGLENFMAEKRIEKCTSDGEKSIFFGIGALWMLAGDHFESNSTYDKIKDKFGRPLIKFAVPINSSEYKTDIYFANHIHYTTHEENNNKMHEAGLIHVVWMDSKDKVKARAKILHYENNLGRDGLELFELPEGYGCIRDKKNPLEYIKKPLDPITFHPEQQFLLEVAFSHRSKCGSGPMKTETAVVKYVTGQLKDSNKYLIVEVEQMIPESPYPQPHNESLVQGPSMKSVKMIYDYSNEYHNLVYTFDRTNNKCSIKKLDNTTTRPTIEFKHYCNQAHTKIYLDLETINKLFNNDYDFHFVKGQEFFSENGVEKIILVQERSVASYEAGCLNGPASIVRKSSIEFSDIENEPYSLKRSQSIVTIYIFESDNRKIIKGKITLKLYEHLEIKLGYVHRQLDVSDCIDEIKKQYATIKYPLRSPDLGWFIARKTNDIYTEFLENLFRTGLEPTQVAKIDISYDHYYMYIRMLLLDGPPLSLRYKKNPFEAFISDSTTSVIIQQIKPTDDSCAEACGACRCVAFSYCNNKRCSLYIRDKKEAKDKTFDGIHDRSNTRVDINCSLYEDYKLSIDHDTKPHHIIRRIRDSMNTTMGLEIPDESSPKCHFYPESIESDLFDEDDLLMEREYSSNDLSLNEGPRDVRNRLHDELVRAQYIIELEGREIQFEAKSAKSFRHRVATDLSYEDCVIFCQDENCLLFSYCEKDLKCTVTNIDRTVDLMSSSIADAHCSIFRRDYLSKFEVFSNIIRPEEFKMAVLAVDVRECANICMESDQLNCLSFDFCQMEWWLNSKNDTKVNCYLHTFHGRSEMLSSNSGQYSSHRLSEHDESSSCNHYSRSYLADFDKYFSAHLNEDALQENGGDTNKRILVEGADAETCAKLCIENAICAGFSSCFNARFSKELECFIAQTNVQKKHIFRHDHCNTFLLSKKSQFSTEARRMVPNNETEIMDPMIEEERALPEHHSAQYSSTGGTLVNLLVLVAGVAIGSGSVIAYKKM